MKPPKFKARKGQVDFTNIRWVPVINCVVSHKDTILLVQRNKDMHLYPGYWNGISGFLDDSKSLAEKVCEELQEEIGLDKKEVISIKLGQVFDQDEPKYKKTWIVHPVLVKVNTNKVKLDWEAQKYKWVKAKDIKTMDILPGFDKIVESFNLFK